MKKLKDIWGELPDLEHTQKFVDERTGLRMYQICGKKFQETARIDYVLPILETFIEKYGHRARLAKDNNSVDFKAVSHAMRYGLQIKELFETEDIIFPLKEAEYLKNIKQGKLNYLKDVAPKLEALMDEIEELSKKTDLPSKPDRKFWNKFLLDTHERIVYTPT